MSVDHSAMKQRVKSYPSKAPHGCAYSVLRAVQLVMIYGAAPGFVSGWHHHCLASLLFELNMSQIKPCTELQSIRIDIEII